MASSHAAVTSEMTHKQAYEQKVTAQLALWNARIQSGLLARKTHRLRYQKILLQLEQAWHSLERFKLTSEHDALAHILWRDVEESLGGVRRSLVAIKSQR